MNAIRNTLTRAAQVITFSALAVASVNATAAVKFRVGFDAASNQYAVYMTPDSVPSPDMLLSAQVTLVVPHATDAKRFNVENISSNIPGINWVDHSRVDAPKENQAADYISLGYYFSGTKVSPFGWVAGQEKQILTFTSTQGCVAGVKLIDSKDAFNQLPNSAGTNPGNDFLNIGWKMTNAYIGNYGDAVTCSTPGVITTPPSSVTPPAACIPTSKDVDTLKKIEKLKTLKAEATSVTRQQQIEALIGRYQNKLSCKA
ncbi:cadherin [Candidatus Thiothrix anitrata]|jgi:hypothetical protein|uniref:Cadherin n=1 Tax=Candidatus Thiothrix anitrata TaxID=2823902 RepID=A0ABX7X3F0_9GAMM|nr:cadherin [Candidatus Thiothrix anitrata]QTR50404.1 cadherin [Candidatus Thiothrix anitrata]